MSVNCTMFIFLLMLLTTSVLTISGFACLQTYFRLLEKKHTKRGHVCSSKNFIGACNFVHYQPNNFPGEILQKINLVGHAFHKL